MRNYNNDRVNLIELRHKGYDLKYRHIRNDMYEYGDKVFKLEINFEDTYEIDMLIHILEEMKKGCDNIYRGWTKEMD